MADINPQMVKDLRDKTGAGMMDCKKALAEANGNLEEAIDILRKSGIAKAAKKSSRTAKEGTVAALIKDGVAVMAEVVCETDFAARVDKFRDYAQGLTARVAANFTDNGDVSEKVIAAEAGAIGELVGKIGENIQVRRAVRWVASADSAFAFYLHMGGKIGVLVEAAGSKDEELLHDVCMHVAAFSPSFISPKDVPADKVAREKEIAAAQVVGKPAEMIDKIVQGKLQKWYKEVCLFEQPWIRDDKSSLAKVAPKLQIRRLVRWQVGEEA